jgi:3-isopropylmalate/(R)-2-methylmalate dehydratase small subunit
MSPKLGAITQRTPSGRRVPFAIDPTRRARLLAGLDDLAVTLARLDEVVRFQEADRVRRPWVHHVTAPGGQP